MHFQTEPGQGKLVRCPRGAIFDVAVDLRRGSPTYGQWEGHVLDDETPSSALGAGRLRPRLPGTQRGRRRRLQAHVALRPCHRVRDRLGRPRRRASSGRSTTRSSPTATRPPHGSAMSPTTSRSATDSRPPRRATNRTHYPGGIRRSVAVQRQIRTRSLTVRIRPSTSSASASTSGFFSDRSRRESSLRLKGASRTVPRRLTGNAERRSHEGSGRPPVAGTTDRCDEVAGRVALSGRPAARPAAASVRRRASSGRSRRHSAAACRGAWTSACRTSS